MAFGLKHPPSNGARPLLSCARPRSIRTTALTAPLLQELRHGALAGASQPCLFNYVLEFLGANLVEPDKHRGISVEMWRRKVNAAIAAQQRFFHLKIVCAHAENGPLRRRIAQRRDVGRSQRPLPRKEFLIDDPSGVAARRLLFGSPRQRQSVSSDVAPR